MSNERTKELEPCPFCGRKAIVEEFRDGDDPQPLFVATCEVCPVKTYDQFSAQDAASIWNSRAAVAAPQGDAAKDAAGERERTCYWCKHVDHGQKVCPVPYLAVGEGGLSGSYPCGCTQSTVLSDAPPATQPAARLAAKEVVNELLNVPRFIRNPESTIIEIENKVAAIISRHFPSVQPVEEAPDPCAVAGFHVCGPKDGELRKHVESYIGSTDAVREDS